MSMLNEKQVESFAQTAARMGENLVIADVMRWAIKYRSILTEQAVKDLIDITVERKHE